MELVRDIMEENKDEDLWFLFKDKMILIKSGIIKGNTQIDKTLLTERMF